MITYLLILRRDTGTRLPSVRTEARSSRGILILGSSGSALPSIISGGQKQRAAVARALITRPQLILADEPTGALDSRATDSLLRLFGEINEDGQTILMVTHSVKAASHAGRVMFIKDGEVFHQLYRAWTARRGCTSASATPSPSSPREAPAMRKGFFPRLALSGIRKNRSIYYPYILTAVLTTAMMYIIGSLQQISTDYSGTWPFPCSWALW